MDRNLNYELVGLEIKQRAQRGMTFLILTSNILEIKQRAQRIGN